MDDEGAVARMAQRVLRQAGYSVALASGGEEALELIRESSFSGQLVVLDIMMSDMSGLEVLSAIRVTHPTLPVLLSSGYTPEELGDLTDEYAAFLRKPLDVEKVAALIADVARRPTAAT